MSHAKSLLFKIITRSLFVVGLGVGIVFIPNLSIFDEAQLPEITERLSKQVNPNIEGNAAYHLYGFAAASDKDPYTVGKAVVATLQSKHAKGEMAHLTEQEAAELYGGNGKWDEEWSAIYPAADCKPREKADCFAQLLAQVKSQPFTQPRLLVQLERYNNIIKLPHLIEEMRLMDYTSPFPNYYIVMQMGKLSQANAYHASGLDGLISNSQADMQFWRMALADSQTLLGRMVTLASLRRNLSALSFAIGKEAELSPTQIQSLQTLLKPLTSNETSMDRALTGELRFGAENWKTAPNETPEGESRILSHLTQPTASANLFYLHTLKPTFALSQMSSKDFYERAQTPVKALEFSRFNPYNLGGKIYLSKNWQLSPYIGRTHDLAGLYSLVALQLELKTNPPQDVIAAIKSSPYKNPYTEKPFDYDPATKALSFQCFEVKDVCKITL
jgi:hypothetical protein